MKKKGSVVRRRTTAEDGSGRERWETMGAVREYYLLNVSPNWVILMENVKDAEVTGGRASSIHTEPARERRHADLLPADKDV